MGSSMLSHAMICFQQSYLTCLQVAKLGVTELALFTKKKNAVYIFREGEGIYTDTYTHIAYIKNMQI